ncbi:serine hydrolase domain-containing protein [Novosphingobium panipatense]|jgi:CubicO group peptidase (beta-lactamase class C family)|uniref:CubicO group peptidase, beta-lactamase class C family n=1 Tax=Novosphingobium panipatense TaxID=428991 RepID=A0ABY1QCH6_9SPHN|nr:serine hydrolase [Novosphingobium panipatense]SMP67342.1 CubicO group peptidase, beta-lactamase class C family [Novosphingobium panipatense]
MSVRRPPLILAMLALPALWGCGERAADGPPPPSAEALAAIADAGGAPRESLGRSIDRLFDEERVGKTDALLIVKRGTLIVERYGDGIEADTRLPGWSAGQCITALMIGQLVSDGRLRIAESAPVPEWQRPGDPRGVITLRQLLQMRSGLRHVETAPVGTGRISGESDRTRMLFLDGRDDMASYAEAQPLEAPAGKVFEHSSASAVILSDLAARVLSSDRNPDRRRHAVGEYLRHRVLAPIGMNSTLVAYDRAGTMIGSGMIAATARDWSKLGEFLRHSGSVKGAQILPRRWVQFMLEPSPREPAYGAGVWLNRGEAGDGARLWPATAPRSVFACLGEYGQYVIGSPDQLLTVVRIGHSNPEQEREVRDELGALLALFPKN